MSTSSKNTWLYQTLSVIWRTSAVIVVCFAVLLTAIRLALPHTNEVNKYVSNFLSQQLNADISITEIEGYWAGSGPRLSLHKVALRPLKETNNTSQSIEFTLENIYVEIDMLASLLSWDIVTDKFELQGLALDLDISRAASSPNQNDPISALQADDTDPNLPQLLKDILLHRLEYFSVIDSHVDLKFDKQTQRIDIANLLWLNKGLIHKGQGEIFFNNNAQNNAQLSAQLTGSASNLNGTIFLEIQNIAFGQLLANYLPSYISLDESVAQGNAWFTITQSELNRVSGQITPTQLRWSTDNDTLVTSIQNIDFMAVPDVQDWHVYAQNVVIGIDDEIISTDFSVHSSAEGILTLTSDAPFDVTPLRHLGEFFLPNTQQLWFEQAGPKATVEQLSLFKNSDYWGAHIALNPVAFEQTTLPGINALGLDVYAFQDLTNTTVKHAPPVQMGISLTAQDDVLQTDQLLAQNLALETLTAQLYFQISPFSVSMLPSHLTINTDLVDAALAFSYRADIDVLALQGSFSPDKIEHVVKLLPTQLMGKNTYNYLKRALATTTQTGRVDQAELLWFGAAQDFPFERNNGIFQAQLTMREGEFAFSPDWPALSEMDLHLAFENNNLTMQAPTGKLLDVTLSDLNATLPGLNSQSVLTIDAKGEGTGFALASLMQQSSMADSLGKILTENIIISNELSADVNLTIPLDSADIMVTGKVNLPNNYVQFLDVDFALTQAKGQVAFTNAQIEIEQLSAELFDQPIKLSFIGDTTTDGYQANATLDGDWDIAALASRASPEYADVVKGFTTWSGDLSLLFPKRKGVDYEFTINSDLVGITHELPEPFAKTKDVIMPLSIRLSGANLATQVNATLGNEIRFDGIIPHKEKQFSRAHLALGESEFQGMGVGFSISAALEQVDVALWYQTISKLLNGMDGNGTPLFGSPERIFMQTEKMTLANQVITDVNATAKQADNNWLIELNSREARGEIRFYNDWLGRGIDIQADYINVTSLNALTSDNIDGQLETAQPRVALSDNEYVSSPRVLPQQLPPIAFTCTQCRFLDNYLGEVILQTKPTEKGLEITQLRTQNDHGGVNLTGTWTDKTFVKGRIESDDFGAFLDEFNFSTGIKDSQASFEVELNWDNAPFDFDFANVNGAVDWSLTDGYITEISDKGSRIFTLLSLDSLVRKLSLDFRDVFAKGFFYDKINGTMSIENGIALTDDTIVDGGAGEIEITGYTDLVEQQLNYTVSFAPNVTGNLPALVYFMVNPPTAIAALAVNQVLTSTKVFSNINYSIKGNFDAPVITELERQSTEIDLPKRANAQRVLDEDEPLTELDKQPLVPIIQPTDN